MRRLSALLVILCLCLTGLHGTAQDVSGKTCGVLFPRALVERAVENAQTYDWARQIQANTIANAKPWLETSDEDLWRMAFGPGITRSWMVWSDGFCPACKRDVRMYNWKIDIWNHPFKVQCPHCETRFPTNDFEAYYRTGLNTQGFFEPSKADRSLLFNPAHPDPNDPLHLFGVDDGEGYVNEGKCWRFIGYYLIAGQWRQLLVGGTRALAQAYGVTGDFRYAHKAAILLDRIADFYPTFDFKTQGLVYEKGGHQGAVTVWHDACEEVRELAQAYDCIFDSIDQDQELVTFLSGKAAQLGLENQKQNTKAIKQNIEERILKETLSHPERIQSNYPRTPVALLTIEAVLGWPANREVIDQHFREMLQESLKEDGMTGEKGLAGYSTIFPSAFAEVAMRFDRANPGFLDDLLQKYPDLLKTYRFHLDTWCLQKYYPHIGDSGAFGIPVSVYKGVSFSRGTVEPSMDSFLFRLYEVTGDKAYVQAMYLANGSSVEGLPHDLFAADPKGVQDKVRQVIDEAGTEIPLGDVNKEEWGISILRAGTGENQRAVWIDQDAGGRHGHRGALNIGLFAKGLDLLPDFGYPPVGYGGWGSPKALWYTRTAAHNTVVIDGKDLKTGKGKVTLWASGMRFHLVEVEAAELASASEYTRSVAMVDIDDKDSYVIDLFRVKGGVDHAKFLTAFFGKVETEKLTFSATTEYGFDTQTRAFRTDSQAKPGWYVDWTIEDRYQQATPGGPVHLRYTDLTSGAMGALGECWITGGQFSGDEEWVPRVMVRRCSDTAPLDSCFVSLLEPYTGEGRIQSVRRLRLKCDGQLMPEDDGVGLEVVLRGGVTHLYAQVPEGILPESESAFEIDGTGVSFRGRAVFLDIQRGLNCRTVLCKGTELCAGSWLICDKQAQDIIEVEFQNGEPRVVTGREQDIEIKGGTMCSKGYTGRTEELRPQFHFTAPTNWLNDPNGLVYYKGEYHLFYQHNPFGINWGNMHWGHAVSPDLVHWSDLPIALAPDEDGTCFSGSAVVDWNNTSGFKTGDEDVLVALYTGEGHGQCVAYSNDRGRTWSKYEKNPVISLWPDRDPKVIWHKPTGQWVMALYIESGSRKGKKGIAFFTSPNLKEWTYQSEISDFFECPDLFELPVDGDKSRTRWVVLAANGKYLIGGFDGKQFTPDTELLTGDWGKNFYASQSYSDIPEEDGRRIQIAWMNGGEYPGMPFNQQMSFPCELTLRTFEDGIRVCRYPVKEIETLYGQSHELKDLDLKPGDNLLDGVHGEFFDIQAEIEPGEATEIGFVIRGEKVSCLPRDLKLICLGKEAELGPFKTKLDFRILVDRTSLEVFVDRGRVSMTSCFLPKPEEKGVGLYSVGGTAKVIKVCVNELRSAWK